MEFYFRHPFGFQNELLAKRWLSLEPKLSCVQKETGDFFFATVTLSSIMSDMPIISNNCFPLAMEHQLPQGFGFQF